MSAAWAVWVLPVGVLVAILGVLLYVTYLDWRLDRRASERRRSS